MIGSYQEMLLEVNPRFTTMGRKRRERAWNSAIHPDRILRSFARNYLRRRLCSCGTNEALFRRYFIRLRIFTEILFDPQSNPKDVHFWVNVSFPNMTMLDPILHVRLQPPMTSAFSVHHIRRTRQNWPQVISTSLDDSKSHRKERLSDSMKRYSRWCMIGLHTRPRALVLQESKHFI